MIKTSKGDFPIYFGMNAFARFGDMTGKSMTAVMESIADLSSLKMSEMLAFIYSGFIEGCRREGVECLIESVETIGDMIDDDPDLMTRVMTAYTKQSIPEDAEAGDGKKK